MRIYKSDGSFVDHPNDTSFGWYFTEITVDEAIPNYAQRNQETRSIASLKKRGRHDPHFDYSIEFVGAEELPAVPVIEAVLLPDVKVHQRMETVQQPDLGLQSLDVHIPAKGQVASLIDPCSIESKLLLSVVHHAQYAHLVKDVLNLGDLRNNKRIKQLIHQKSEDLEAQLRKEVNNYHKIKEDNMLSIMMELVLSDMRCEVGDIADRHESSDLGASCSSSSSSEVVSRRDFSSLGFSEALDRSIGHLCNETNDIHDKINEIRRSFQSDELRLNSLSAEAQNFAKNLRETKFLDNLLRLLDGKVDGVRIDRSPFLIFLANGRRDNETNLIV